MLCPPKSEGGKVVVLEYVVLFDRIRAAADNTGNGGFPPPPPFFPGRSWDGFAFGSWGGIEDDIFLVLGLLL